MRRAALLLSLVAVIAIVASGGLPLWPSLAAIAAVLASGVLVLWYLFRTWPIESRYAWPPQDEADKDAAKRRRAKARLRTTGAKMRDD
jgi:hypothetical protein